MNITGHCIGHSLRK